MFPGYRVYMQPGMAHGPSRMCDGARVGERACVRAGGRAGGRADARVGGTAGRLGGQSAMWAARHAPTWVGEEGGPPFPKGVIVICKLTALQL